MVLIIVTSIMYYSLQGILFSTPECIRTPIDFVKLWLHEASRVYGDKLIEVKDMDNFQKIKFEVAKAGFEVSICNTSLDQSKRLSLPCTDSQHIVQY